MLQCRKLYLSSKSFFLHHKLAPELNATWSRLEVWVFSTNHPRKKPVLNGASSQSFELHPNFSTCRNMNINDGRRATCLQEIETELADYPDPSYASRARYWCSLYCHLEQSVTRLETSQSVQTSSKSSLTPPSLTLTQPISSPSLLSYRARQ